MQTKEMVIFKDVHTYAHLLLFTRSYTTAAEQSFPAPV